MDGLETTTDVVFSIGGAGILLEAVSVSASAVNANTPGWLCWAAGSTCTICPV